MKQWFARFCTIEVGILLIAAILLFANLGSGELNSADEAIHAQVAREMAFDGNWLYPTYRGEPYLEKPPLKFWLTALTFYFAGVSEFTARFWSALFGLGTIGAIMQLGKLMFNRTVGLWSGLILLTTWEFLFNHCARTGELDSALLFFTVLAISDLWRFRTTESTRSLYRSALWFALGFLTKGHLALIPLLWIPLVWQGKADPMKLSLKSFGNAFLIFIALIAPWIALQLLHYGSFFWDYNFSHNLVGYLGGNVEHAQTSVFYYIQRVLWLNYPWPPFVILGGIILFQGTMKISFPKIGLSRRWILSWIGIQFIILGISQTKLPWYHLPLLIPLALLAGLALERIWNSVFRIRSTHWDVAWLFFHVGLFFCLTGFTMVVFEYFDAWRQGHAIDVANFTYYFFKDSQQRSVLIGLCVLPIGLTGVILRRWYGNRPSRDTFMKTLSKIQVAGFMLVAILFTWTDVVSSPSTENAKQTVNETLLPRVKVNELLKVHVFDQYAAQAPHYWIPPSLYFYLASSPQLQINHHPAIETQWKEFLKQISEPCFAIVPSTWVDSNVLGSHSLTLLQQVKKTRIVYIE